MPIGVLQLGDKRLMSATSVNVSEGGMFLGSEELLDIGTELVCNVPLERQEEAIQLRARVAWLRPSWCENDKRPRGMGIEFIDLSDRERGALRSLVGDSSEQHHAVKLKLPGLGGPVQAKAQLSPEGIFLRVPLPFLKLDSEVEFEFEDDDVGECYRGRLAEVKLHENDDSLVPRLQVEIELTSIDLADEDAPRVEAESEAPIEEALSSSSSIPVQEELAADEGEDEVCAPVSAAQDDDTERMEVAEPSGFGALANVQVHCSEPGNEELEITEAGDSAPLLLVNKKIDEIEAQAPMEEPLVEKAPVEQDELESDECEESDWSGRAIEAEASASFTGDIHADEEDDESFHGTPTSEDKESAEPIFVAENRPSKHGFVESLVFGDESDIDEGEEELPLIPDKKLALATGAVAIVAVMGLGYAFIGGGDSGSAAKKAAVADEQANEIDQERERVAALIEGRPQEVEGQAAFERIRARAVADEDSSDDKEELGTGSPLSNSAPEAAEPARAPKPLVAAPVAKPAPKPVQASLDAPPRAKDFNFVDGSMRVSSTSKGFVVKIPFEGDTDRAKGYRLAEPAAFAVNLPFATPTKGYKDYEDFEYPGIRHIWLRERLGGLHLRVFFKSKHTHCEMSTEASTLTLTCTE